MATDAESNYSLEAFAAKVRAAAEHLVTEDDTPRDSIFAEKQQRLLIEPLFSSWADEGAQRPFVAMANVGLFYAIDRQPLVPDMLLSLDVKLPANAHLKHNRSYFLWEYGKAPDVVVEIVGDCEGGEDTDKLAAYARMGIRYYVIFDPARMLGAEELRVYRLVGRGFQRLEEPIWLPDVGLGLRTWQGKHEHVASTWLRWVDMEGKPVPTGRERAEQLAERSQQLGFEPR